MFKATIGMLGRGSMIEKPVEQTIFIKEEDYNLFWETKIAKLVEVVYKSDTNFINAYTSNPKKVMGKLVFNMKVVPIDLKETLQAFLKVLVEGQPTLPDGGMLA